MSNSVIITLCCVMLAAWIAWLLYNYAIFNKKVAIEAEVDYWKNKTKRIRNCISDLVATIHEKFPKSTIVYAHNDEVDEISGEIKY